MAKRKFRAAVVQTLAALGDLDANIALLERYTREAVRQGARLVVFPECMNTGYLFDSPEHCARLAEPLNGRYVQAMAGLAKKHRIHLASGFTEKGAGGKAYNSGLLIGPGGDLLVHYQKQFLATHDQNWFEFGVNGCPVADTELGRIGLLICFDGRIPEIARCLALQGAEIVVDMANFFAMDQAEMWVPARAFENGVWFVAATKAGVERSIYYPGGSMIVAPSGEVLARLPYDTHGVATAEIDPAAAAAKSWPLGGDKLADRRPDAYGVLGMPFDKTPLAPLLKKPLVPEEATTKAAAVQVHATSRPGSLDAAFAMVEHAALLGVKVIALPQHFNAPSWLPDAAEGRLAAQGAQPCVERAAALAAKYGCAIVLPLIEQAKGGFAPTAILLGPDGKAIGKQQQVHLEPETARWATAGDGFQVFETPFGRIGMMLGYDGLYPESARALTLLGADMVIWSGAWRHRYERELLAVPKAEDNRVYAVFANRTDCPYPGGSFIVPPNGFPHWDVNHSAPAATRHGAVMPCFVNLAMSRQKKMIPKVDMLRNRLVATYDALVMKAA